MTTGEFKSFPIGEIWVDRETRQRRELEGIDELAESINRIGLIHPPVIKRDGELVAGERRWLACQVLGWTDIPIQFVDEIDEQLLILLELEENTRRRDISWQDQCKAVTKYHEVRTKLEPDWTISKTAEALSLPRSEVHDRLNVAENLEAGEELVVKAEQYSAARNVTRRIEERKKSAALEGLDLQLNPEEVSSKKEVPLLNVDFNEWSETYAGPSFNFIHCDFPYGIDAGEHQRGGTAILGAYDDSSDVYWTLIDGLKRFMEVHITQSAHMIFWFSPKFFEDTRYALTKMGWTVDPFPLVWAKSDNAGVMPDPQRGGRRNYETAFFCYRGDRKVVQPVSYATYLPTTAIIHPHEKTKQMLSHYFRMVVDQYTVMLDPTCGSGNAVRVAQDMGAASVLGLEKEEKFFTLAKEHYHD